ncbi:MAG: AraC family transcriptional regulator [Bacteroidota bacterium]
MNHTEPHRTDFFTLALNFGNKDLFYSLNENTFENPKNFILCVAPGQIAQWDKQGDWFGYCAFFKNELFHFNEKVNFLQQYPFFNINETNLIPVDETEFKSLKLIFEEILVEEQKNDKFSFEIVKSHFQTILWKVRRLYENSLDNNQSKRAGSIITSQFQYLVNVHFREKIAVEDYADLLNISPNHLSQTIKKTIGKTTKSIISQRRLNEAKYLLCYTNSGISEIAYHLNFSEPTHFTKFFKKGVSKTPQEYRSEKSLV